MDNDHIEVEQTNTNHQLEKQLRISFASDRPNVKTWAEIEAEYKHDGTRVVDKSTGLPIPPKSMKELDTWLDPKNCPRVHFCHRKLPQIAR